MIQSNLELNFFQLLEGKLQTYKKVQMSQNTIFNPSAHNIFLLGAKEAQFFKTFCQNVEPKKHKILRLGIMAHCNLFLICWRSPFTDDIICQAYLPPQCTGQVLGDNFPQSTCSRPYAVSPCQSGLLLLAYEWPMILQIVHSAFQCLLKVKSGFTLSWPCSVHCEPSEILTPKTQNCVDIRFCIDISKI